MSVKRIFPPDNTAGSPGEQEPSQDDALNEDRPGTDGNQHFSASNAARGKAAYAASEFEMPPHHPRGFGPIGGLFTDDAAGPVGHGMQFHQQGDGGDPLSVIAQDALEAECKKRVCPHCPVKKEAEEVQLRALADLDNARKRLTREREEQVRFAAEAILTDIIPSLDNLDLALQHASSNEACKDFVTGVRMTRKLMRDALTKHGLQEVGAVGEEFNPAVHEAVGMTPSQDVSDGQVCALLSGGYSLNGRLLRPARVMVCRNS
jgi:molecular chaperone GrpE